MYRQKYQRGMLTIFFSVGSKPLAEWDTHIQDGYISRFMDNEIKSTVFEIGGTNVSTTYMICPKGKEVLGINMPFLVMIVKNLNKYFSFEVTILDDTKTRRRFRVSNFQSNTQILPLCTVMPICLSEGWNQIQFNLAEFTRRAYKKSFVEVQKVKINANIRLRRVYFADRIYAENQLPAEYKLYFPLVSKEATGRKPIAKTEDLAEDKENVSSKTAMKRDDSKPESTSMRSIKTPSRDIEIQSGVIQAKDVENDEDVMKAENVNIEQVGASISVTDELKVDEGNKSDNEILVEAPTVTPTEAVTEEEDEEKKEKAELEIATEEENEEKKGKAELETAAEEENEDKKGKTELETAIEEENEEKIGKTKSETATEQEMVAEERNEIEDIEEVNVITTESVEAQTEITMDEITKVSEPRESSITGELEIIPEDRQGEDEERIQEDVVVEEGAR